MKTTIKIFLTCIVINLISINTYSQYTIDNKYVKDKINAVRSQLKFNQFATSLCLKSCILAKRIQIKAKENRQSIDEINFAKAEKEQEEKDNAYWDIKCR